MAARREALHGFGDVFRIPCLLAIVWIASPCGDSGAQPLFQSAYLGRDVGPFPRDVAISDLDRDGRPDLAVCNSANTISLWFGDGTGELHGRTDLDAGRFPSSITVTDFNEDGFPDLAIADQDPGSLLMGRGDGTFESRRSLEAGVVTTSIASADLNQDGHADLVLGDLYSNQLVALLGRGDGTFLPGIASAPQSGPWSIEIGDLSGDGLLDVAVASLFNDAVSMWIGAGDGTFGAGSVVPVGDEPNSIALGDLDGSGTLDIAVTNSRGDSVSVILFGPNGTPGPPQNIKVRGPSSIVSADFTKDGLADLALSTFQGEVVLIPGRADGALREASRSPGGFFCFGMAASDMNADGWLDLAVPSDDHFISVLLGRAGGFGGAEVIPMESAPAGLASGDLNEDGRVDLVCGLESQPPSLTILTQSADGSFQAAQSLPFGTFPISVEVADLDHDGHLDIIGSGFAGITIFRGLGNEQFEAGVLYDVGFARSVEIGDLNADGEMDLAVTDTSLVILLGTGGGALGEATRYGTDAFDSVVGDFNRDGFLDVATAGAELLLWLGDGSGRLEPGFRAAIPDGAASIGAGDLDHNGALDLVTGGSYVYDATRQRAGAIFMGLGDGTFSSARPIGQAFYGRDLEVVDVNADTHLDVLMVGSGFSVMMLKGQGNGDVEEARHYGSGMFPTSLLVRDLNADGRVDLATANWYSEDVSVLRNQGAGAPVPPSASRNAVLQNRPNPFNPKTTIPYDLASDGTVVVRVYDLAGRLVRTVFRGPQIAGRREAVWDGSGDRGPAASGVYLYAVTFPDGSVRTGKMTLLK